MPNFEEIGEVFLSYGKSPVDLFDNLNQDFMRYLLGPKSIGFVHSSCSISMQNLVRIGPLKSKMESGGLPNGRTDF